jgi:hypothetical protein
MLFDIPCCRVMAEENGRVILLLRGTGVVQKPLSPAPKVLAQKTPNVWIVPVQLENDETRRLNKAVNIEVECKVVLPHPDRAHNNLLIVEEGGNDVQMACGIWLRVHLCPPLQPITSEQDFAGHPPPPCWRLEDRG